MNSLVDLHVHSYYSDGTFSPEQIIKIALEQNVGWLAITDHDTIEGSKELLKLSNTYDLKCISGVELDAADKGINFHILGYGFDLTNREIISFIDRNQVLLEMVNVKLIEKLQHHYSNINQTDYENFKYDRTKGGWKALHYFIEKGLADNLLEGIQIYAKYNHSYTCVNFPDIKEVCNQIHNAGGKAVLAHPGRVIKTTDINEFYKTITEIINIGIDGIECYYPSHTDEITKACLTLCNQHNLLITSGSDCHGSFENTKIGELKTKIDKVYLGDLL